MFVPTPNQRNNTGSLRDKFVPNPTYTNNDHQSMFVFLGQLMGIALRTVSGKEKKREEKRRKEPTSVFFFKSHLFHSLTMFSTTQLH
jgi:hypothetical protein